MQYGSGKATGAGSLARLAGGLIVAGTFGAAMMTPAAARTPYDGTWSVLIVTESGTCDRAYRYPVLISNGVVTLQKGAAPGISLSGRVASRGSIEVRVSSGERQASGRGRMTPQSGAGTWSGRSSSGACRGRWEAERR